MLRIGYGVRGRVAHLSKGEVAALQGHGQQLPQGHFAVLCVCKKVRKGNEQMI